MHGAFGMLVYVKDYRYVQRASLSNFIRFQWFPIRHAITAIAFESSFSFLFALA